MQYIKFNPWGAINAYYKFKVEVNPEDDTCKLIRIIHKGNTSLFDKIYYHGEILKYDAPQVKVADDQFGDVVIKFKIEDGSSQDPIIQVFLGSQG